MTQTNDYCAVPSFLKDQVGARYPGARRALLKSGGDFPFLSRADEVNLHAQVLVQTGWGKALAKILITNTMQRLFSRSSILSENDLEISGDSPSRLYCCEMCDLSLISKFLQLHLRRAGVEGALQVVPQPLARTPAPKQRNTSYEEEEKRDDKVTSAAVDERPEVDIKKKGINGNTLRRLSNDNLFPSNSSSAEEIKNDERNLIISEERLHLDKDLKKKGLTAGSSMKRLNSGSLFMSSSGSGSFHRNGDPLGPLGNDLLVPQRAFMRPNGMSCILHLILANHLACVQGTVWLTN